MNLFLHHDFSRIPTAYTQACFAICCHAYRFMDIILQTWSWLKCNNSTILVMGNNGIVQCKLTFVQASCFVNGISENNSINVWKTIFFLQTCATREYDVIKMLVLTDDFPRAPFENRLVYLLFSFHLQTGRRVIVTSFSHSYMISYLEFSPPVYSIIDFEFI